MAPGPEDLSYRSDAGLAALARDLGRPASSVAAWFELMRDVEVMNPLTIASAEKLAVRLGGGPGVEALDLGCGKGFFAVSLAERGCRVTAVDRVELCLRRARERARAAGVEGRCRFAAAEASAWAAQSAGAEIVVMLGVASAWGGPAPAVRTLARLVPPGGRLAVGEAYARPGSEASAGGEYLEPGGMRPLLEAAGLAVEAVFDDGAEGWEAYHAPQDRRAGELRRAPGTGAELRETLTWLEAERRWEARNLGWSAWVARKI